MMQLTEQQKKEGWRIVKFDDVAKEVKASTKEPLSEGIDRYVGLEHIDSQSLRLSRWGMIEEDNPSFTKKFSAGDILFGRRRAYLKKAAVPDFDGICSGDIIVMAPKGKDLLPDMLPFIVQSDQFFDWAVKHSAGGLSPRTKFKSLADFEFPLQPRKRQEEMLEVSEKIEGCLFNYEETMLAANRTLEVLRFNLMIKNSDSYPMKSISDLAIINPKCPPTKSKPLTFCDMAALDTDSKSITGKLLVKDKPSGARYQNNDVLFARITPCTENGKLALVDFLDGNETGYGSTEFIVLRGSKVEPLYLYHLCRTRKLRHFAIDRMIGTSGRKRVPKEVFDDIKVPLLPDDTRKNIVSALENIETQKSNIKQAVSQLHSVRSKYLRNILEGQHDRI